MILLYKNQITGILTVETGMHIGGSEVELKIGGLDNAVVKDSRTGIPYIPGSSIKGKLRDLIAKKHGYKSLDDDINIAFLLFGEGAKDKHRNASHLLIRDAFYCGTMWEEETGLENKSENTINRITGQANPRQMERVVRGAQFKLEMVLDIYDQYNVKTGTKSNNDYKKETKFGIYAIQEIKEIEFLKVLKIGFRLLENDYLGGSGARGYGKVTVAFEPVKKIKFCDDGSVTITDNEIDFDFNLHSNEGN